MVFAVGTDGSAKADAEQPDMGVSGGATRELPFDRCHPELFAAHSLPQLTSFWCEEYLGALLRSLRI